MDRRTTFLVPILILLVALSLGAESEDLDIGKFQDRTELHDYVIGPQDVLMITVYEEKELDRKVRVSSSGEISLPLLGKVKVVGLTVSALEDKLTKLLGKDYLVNPQVTVFIEEYSTISVLGKVAKPGSFPLRGNLTVLEAISLAGGFAKAAAPNKTRIIRTEDGIEKIIQVWVGDITEKGDKSKDIYLKPGDIVFVPESFF